MNFLLWSPLSPPPHSQLSVKKASLCVVVTKMTRRPLSSVPNQRIHYLTLGEMQAFINLSNSKMKRYVMNSWVVPFFTQSNTQNINIAQVGQAENSGVPVSLTSANKHLRLSVQQPSRNWIMPINWVHLEMGSPPVGPSDDTAATVNLYCHLLRQPEVEPSAELKRCVSSKCLLF